MSKQNLDSKKNKKAVGVEPLVRCCFWDYDDHSDSFIPECYGDKIPTDHIKEFWEQIRFRFCPYCSKELYRS